MAVEGLDAVLLLIQALGIPWVSGMLIVLALAQRIGQRAHYPLLLFPAYGFFLGLLLLVAAIRASHALGYGIHFLGVMTTLTVLGFAALAAVVSGRQLGPAGPPPGWRGRVWRRLGAALLLLLIGLHFGQMAVEVWWRPVYPWDAWTTWSARAKVWVYHGAITPFVSPAEWFAHPGAEAYTLAAYHYPKFVSLVQAWGGIGLGYWHDSLVNLPWLLCGAAFAMLLYAQARVAGLSALIALLLCYLLVSMPLWHTHIALAGYADLWQAAFTGAAMLALMQWRLGDGDRFQLVLGLAMLTASLFIKEEGRVWALLTLVFLWLVRADWRLLLGLFVAAGSLAFYALQRGSLYLDLPGLGLLGYRDGALIVPFIGQVAVGFVNVAPSLVRSLFQYESWHLLWYGVLGSLPLLWLRPRDGYKQALGLLLALVGAALFVIFFLTEAGNWARDATAFSRVLMQWVPVVLFLQTLVWQRHWRGRAAG